MTSMISYLLSGEIPPRPRGCRVRTVTMESCTGYKRSQGADTNAARAEKTRLANIERIYNAVADGCDTIAKVSDETGLSITTTQKALIALEEEWTPPRIVRQRGRSAHIFTIASEES
jgi:hypothetical protein